MESRQSRRIVTLVIALAVAAPGLAGAASATPVLPLDRESVIALARARSSAILAGRARLGAADGEVARATQWRFNPEVELQAGTRTTPEGETWDRSLWLSQRLDLAGRGPRAAAARWGLDAAHAEQRATEIDVVAESVRLYLVALHAAAERAVASDAVALQARLHEVAVRREAAGEVGLIEVNTAAIALARALASLARAAAAGDAALAELATLLALEPGAVLSVTGDLAWTLPADRGTVFAAAASNPLQAAFAARRAEAEARRDAAGAERWPELSIAAGIGREEDADIAGFGLGVSLPLFARGKGERLAAAAEAAARDVELAALERSLADRLERAWNRHAQLQSALAAYEIAARDGEARGVDLVELGYREGKLGLGDVLAVRREVLDARQELLDLRLDTALAALEVATLAALPPLGPIGPTTGAAEPAPSKGTR
ncbi:MAG TPA: TolC family protein [Candidatus Krumholzibacteria bacterium]|nr:TolC family protein [Candidatus Krumholzibacteria bacterium]HPD70446.1 TolC family protein [Candidatus Krumholzibacteria bacterium]HRY39854.1 TolC family protein [Candidatus Krumholzibacteria bacterium]